MNKDFAARLGNCYELSANFVAQNDGWKLIHGTITADPAIWGPETPTAPNVHAWCEKDGECFDPVLGETMPLDAYYLMFGAKPQKRYHRMEVVKLLVITEHYGPWEDD
jgi:hypothetical protein